MILFACDSFKEFATSIQVSSFIKEGLNYKHKKSSKIVSLSDGGDGFLDSLNAHLNYEIINVRVKDPIGRSTIARIGIQSENAIIEMSEASGVKKFINGERYFLRSSSYGTGELISFAIKNGCRKVFLGLGGAATGDGGIGLAQSLGATFKFKNNKLIKDNYLLSTKDLTEIKDVIINKETILYDDINLTIASDVNNYVVGDFGATKTFGPQKGATEEQIVIIENAMINYLRILENRIGKKLNLPGSGSCGGLVLGLFSIFNYENINIKPGFNVVNDIIELEKKIINSEWIITGEGCFDKLSQFGKPPIEVAKIAKKHGKYVIGVFGMIKDDMKNNTKDFDLVIDCSNNEVLDIHNENYIKIDGPNRLRKAGSTISRHIESNSK